MDIYIDPNPPVISPGWTPAGSSAPSDAPELIIVVVATSTPASADQCTHDDLIGVGVGVGLGEAFLFTVAVAVSSRFFALRRRSMSTNEAAPDAKADATRAEGLDDQAAKAV